ncbi:UPF0184 protein C9orf16 [Chelonus insularis]|uniref:UPF0184 protein C9orf16 n=1 Tax=Chelonus insularis TaxID=460826 RepID=UPI001588C61D|nr:UPF0184 protein C9orf16-like [Chelonus insularis]XP_034952388.1 UPF0184 protein C9orf16-like [Chelonus insularis]
MADAKTMLNAVEPKDNQEHDENVVDTDTSDDEEEFKNLNAQLDQLNSVLDSIEMKNDIVHAEFVKLLNSNREARKQFQESLNEQPAREGTTPDPQ